VRESSRPPSNTQRGGEGLDASTRSLAHSLLRVLLSRTALVTYCTHLQYGESGVPDVWFEPVAVWEIKAADLSISPLHQVGVGVGVACVGSAFRQLAVTGRNSPARAGDTAEERSHICPR
jgi:hypothetical protein